MIPLVGSGPCVPEMINRARGLLFGRGPKSTDAHSTPDAGPGSNDTGTARPPTPAQKGSGAMRKTDPAKHRARRRHIVHTAAQLFATKGFERTTTAEICKAAGMSSGNLFHYFPNKRAIFHAIFDDADD